MEMRINRKIDRSHEYSFYWAWSLTTIAIAATAGFVFVESNNWFAGLIALVGLVACVFYLSQAARMFLEDWKGRANR